MRTYTNMAWPDDPYRTGQQLYPRPAPRLAAFATGPVADGSRSVPAAVATVYLPLHRTRAVAVTEQTLAFGFHAACIDDAASAPALAAVADRDLLRARRHAAILAGHLLDRELAALQPAAAAAVLRGLAAVAQDWADRSRSAPGRAAMFDSGDLQGRPPLARACRHAGIAVGLGCDAAEADDSALGEVAAAVAVERALTIALLCARHLARYTWDAPLRTGRILARAAWDCFPHLATGGGAAALPSVAAAGQAAPSAAGAHRSLE